ncbi:MAG TPA: hypothetical protein PLC40_10400, partial [Candidatus Hydrogenedentes bacterium]|nr:hypothetical protein [Candidatus Hydrogenedentota bacterium]
AYAGLSIVISFAFIYGDQVIQWSGNTQVFMFIITQVTAAAGAFLFGFLQDTWNSKKTYLLTLIVWTVTACLIYGVFQITDFINKLFSLSLKAEHIFLMIATFAGLGRALIGGLVAGTILTLFVVPIFYGLLEDFNSWFRSFLANIKMSPVRKS